MWFHSQLSRGLTGGRLTATGLEPNKLNMIELIPIENMDNVVM